MIIIKSQDEQNKKKEHIYIIGKNIPKRKKHIFLFQLKFHCFEYFNFLLILDMKKANAERK